MPVVERTRRMWEALVDDPRTERAARRVPWVWARAERAGRRHGGGVTRDEAFATVRDLGGRGLPATVDPLHRAAPTLQATEGYVTLAGDLGDLPAGTWLAVDLALVGLDHSVERCRHDLARVLDALPVGCWLQVAASDRALTGAAVDVVLTLAAESAPLVATVAANLRRSRDDARELAEAEVPIRLVEGTPAPPSVAHPLGTPTDLAYARLAQDLRAAGARVLLATRQAPLRASLLATLGPGEVELPLGAPLHPAYDPLTRRNPVRVTVPYGPGWFRTWLRSIPAA